MIFHLTARVAWHDTAWNGKVCNAPSCNAYCAALDRIREERNDEAEDKIAGKPWSKLKPAELPVCKAESGAFMSPEEWTREYVHPYADIKKADATHGHLKPTLMKIPAYSTFAVPFAWMLQSEQKAIDEKLPDPLPADEDSPFNTAWVFGRKRQGALVDLFFGRLMPEKSLVFFYCKEGQPLGDAISRLVVGVGRITKIAPLKTYESRNAKPGYPMWDRLFSHSIRPDGIDGFLLPYHEYIEPTGNPEEDQRRLDLLREIAVPADSSHIRLFSYAAELAPSDIALSTLIRCLEAVRKIRAHGIAKGPWDKREEWLNEQIALTWKDRGAFPGLGPALEALGMRLGTSLSLDLISSKMIAVDDNPWPVVDSLLRGNAKPPLSAYAADLKTIRDTWMNLPEERRMLLMLLSRFALTTKQAKRWFDPYQRAEGTEVTVSDKDIIENPYRMSEIDLGDWSDAPVSVGMIDRGLFPESTIAARHPVPAPSCVGSPNDSRRIRAAIVAVLRQAALNGDALLSMTETLRKVAQLDFEQACMIGADWAATNKPSLEGVVEIVDILTDKEKDNRVVALQLSELKAREDRLRSILSARAMKKLPIIKEDWRDLLVKAISEAGGSFDPENERHALAIEEQAKALEKVTSRRLTALIGRAGTGKTSVMGAIMLSKAIAKEGILLLAPTGKARVRLGKAANAEAMTVAQFLNRLGRYDGTRQRPLFKGNEKHRKEKTVVIDECSMLTMDDLFAVLESLDLAHVQRLILVGDPNQLPPIGVGRPFADLVTYFETVGQLSEAGPSVEDALARLTVEVRATVTNDTSDSLRLASWFTREKQPVDADRVLSDLEIGEKFNDLDIMFWKTAEELRERLLTAFQSYLGIKDSKDVAGFDKSLGLDDRGWVPFEAPIGAELWQILTPVRMQSHGVHDLNRWVQRQFRAKELASALNPWGNSLSDESIVVKDKVIQTVNQSRNAFDGKNSEKHYLANGEVGLVAPGKGGWLNVLFSDRANLRFGYSKRDFPSGAGPLQLAYALTVHKAQGSEFKKVFVVIPKNCRLLSRELLYTALTRSRERLVLLIEGSDASVLFDLTRPERSETARRNTNLFQGVLRVNDDEMPYAEHLIHKTEKGHMVRSKSELVIANMLFENGIEYEYERVFEGPVAQGRLRPDFSFITPAGDTIIWEHLGMMNREDYRRGWEWKQQWYGKNGLIEGETLFSTQDDERGGLDSDPLKSIALKIKSLCE